MTVRALALGLIAVAMPAAVLWWASFKLTKLALGDFTARA